MATNKHAIIRYQALDKCFSNYCHRFYIDDLIEACNNAIYEFTGITEGVKRRQIFLDITFMESSQGCGIPLERIKDGRRVYYRYVEKDFSINKKPLAESELMQLKETIIMLSRFKGIAQFEWLEEFLSAIEDKFQLKGTTVSYIGFEQNTDLEGLTYFSLLIEHIIYKNVLKIEYQAFGKPLSIWTIHPYYLKQYNSRWFLFGLNDDCKTISNLPLDRIKSIELTNKNHIDNDTIDFEKYFDNVIGVTIPLCGEQTKVTLKLSEEQLPYVLSKPLHLTQKIKDRDNGILEITVIPNKELESLILSFGSQVEILSPIFLREQIKNHIVNLNKKYKCK